MLKNSFYQSRGVLECKKEGPPAKVKEVYMKKVKRDYKSRMFTMIFSDKKGLLELYNAVAKRDYKDPELLIINTLENAIYMSMQNDISFLIDFRLPLYEHQSSYNPNIPLRFLMYISDLYSKLTANKNLYGTKLVKIPTPQFIVFYNGIQKRPEQEVLKLSSAYIVEEVPSLELTVYVLNINEGCNEELKKTCKTLNDYSIYVQRVRNHKTEGMTIEEAVELSVDECIRDNVLREFLIQNKAEAMAMSIYEYNEEEHMRMEREQHYEDGMLYGVIKTLQEFDIPEEEIVAKIMTEYNLNEETAKELCQKNK